MLYTRKGDDGRSGLFGTQERLSKGHLIFDALGTLDELNSFLGVCRARGVDTLQESGVDIREKLLDAQEGIFTLQAELAGSDKKISRTRIVELEDTIDYIEMYSGRQHSFVVPGTTTTSALFDYARTIARRAERTFIRVQAVSETSNESRIYLNRLSSFLYALARYSTIVEGKEEMIPSYD